jgi:hypothetical protein
VRTASCRCGQLSVSVTGDPVRVSVCHCLNCKKRSGSAFAAQARWPAEHVVITGESKTFVKAGDAGTPATFHFCPECGSDVYYVINGDYDGLIAIPVGAFDDPFPFPPDYSVYEGRKHAWVEIKGDLDHID